MLPAHQKTNGYGNWTEFVQNVFGLVNDSEWQVKGFVGIFIFATYEVLTESITIVGVCVKLRGCTETLAFISVKHVVNSPEINDLFVALAVTRI